MLRAGFSTSPANGKCLHLFHASELKSGPTIAAPMAMMTLHRLPMLVVKKCRSLASPSLLDTISRLMLLCQISWLARDDKAEHECSAKSASSLAEVKYTKATILPVVNAAAVDEGGKHENAEDSPTTEQHLV
jgi:hypothetical protein